MGHTASIIIEKANWEDLDLVSMLYDELCDYLADHENYPGWSKGFYPVRPVAEAALEQDCLYVARKDCVIIGTVILNHRQEPAYADAAWLVEADGTDIAVIHTLAVHPRYLRCGAGRALMAFAVDWAIERGCKAIRLDTYEKNIPAMQLYETMGFRFCGKVDLGYRDYGREWYHTYELPLP